MESSDEFGGNQFAKNLRARRKERGLTQEELAHEAGVHLSEVSRIERRERDPGVTVVVRLARALGIPPAELFEGIP